MPEVIMYMLGGVVILDHLILHNAHASLGLGHFCQGNSCLVSGHGRLLADLVHLFLCELAVNSGCRAHFCQFSFQSLHRVNSVNLLCHVVLLSAK